MEIIFSCGDVRMVKKVICPRCGLKLDETTLGRSFCKNCGIIDEELESKLKKEEMEYVG